VLFRNPINNKILREEETNLIARECCCGVWSECDPCEEECEVGETNCCGPHYIRLTIVTEWGHFEGSPGNWTVVNSCEHYNGVSYSECAGRKLALEGNGCLYSTWSGSYTFTLVDDAGVIKFVVALPFGHLTGNSDPARGPICPSDYCEDIELTGQGCLLPEGVTYDTFVAKNYEVIIPKYVGHGEGEEYYYTCDPDGLLKFEVVEPCWEPVFYWGLVTDFPGRMWELCDGCFGVSPWEDGRSYVVGAKVCRGWNFVETREGLDIDIYSAKVSHDGYAGAVSKSNTFISPPAVRTDAGFGGLFRRKYWIKGNPKYPKWWKIGRYYPAGSLVHYYSDVPSEEDVVYRCLVDHVSTILRSPVLGVDWEEIEGWDISWWPGSGYQGLWRESKDYVAGDLIYLAPLAVMEAYLGRSLTWRERNDELVFCCVEDHNSGSSASQVIVPDYRDLDFYGYLVSFDYWSETDWYCHDRTNWEGLYVDQGVNPLVGSVVIDTYWEDYWQADFKTELDITQWEGVYNPASSYLQGDHVYKEGEEMIYAARFDTPVGSPAWAENTSYTVDDLVTYIGNIYVCGVPHNSGCSTSLPIRFPTDGDCL